MNSPYRRNKGVNEALAERMPVATGTDTETFAALYERTFPRVYAYVASLLRDRSAAEDVTAQAFERAYRRRATYRKRRGSHEAWLFGIARNAALDELRRRKRRARLEAEPEDTGALGADDHADLALRREAWLFGIARNAALDELRRRKRRARLEAEPEDADALGADDHAELALRREAVRAAMGALDGRERDLLALKFSAGLSNSEIAKVLELSETAVGTRLHRTLTKLRKACHE